jgi:hypothetical protein
MQLTRQQKIYAAVLLLAGVAFGMDRWVIGHGPDEASAAAPRNRMSTAQSAPPAIAAGGVTGEPRGSTPVASAAVSAPFTGASTAGSKPGPSRSLAVRLQEVVKVEGLDLSAVPDAFRPSRRWDPPDALLPVAPVAPAPPPKFDLASQFRSRHKLNAVMKGHAGVGGVAIVDRRMRAVGQQVDGLTLVEVREQSAVFEGPGATPADKLSVELFIDTPQPQDLD